MPVMQSLRDLYFKIEDKYYDFLDWLDSKGIPVYRVVDAIEKRHIPTFPVAVGCTAAVLIILWAILTGAFAGSLLTVFVEDESGTAVAGASIEVSWEGLAQPLSAETDELGKATSLNVPRGIELSISVGKEGYESESATLTAQEAAESKQFTIAEILAMFSRSIELFHSGTSESIGDYVTVDFSCSGNSDYEASESTSNGEITLEDVPSDCGTLYASPGNGYSAVQNSFDAGSSETYELYLLEPGSGTGSVEVYVADSQGAAVSGALVTLTTSSGAGVETKPVLGAGSASFSNIPAGRYYIMVYDPQNNYAEYSSASKGEIKDLLEGQTLTFYATLDKRTVGKIRLLARDLSTLLPVRNASVTLSKDGVDITPLSTDNDGKIEFGVGENVAYEVRIDHPDYIIEELSGIYPGADFTEILLTPATIENSMSLTVKVSDERAKPVENARLRLKKLADGLPVSDELVTGTSGSAVFTRVPEGAYFVYAYKPGYGETNSDPITISAREANEIEITLPIGSGMLSVSVLDEQKQPLAGASIKIIDFYSRQVLSEQLTTSTGTGEFTVRADKAVYAIASAPDKLKYITSPVQMVKDATKSIEVVLSRSVPTLSVELLELYYGEEAAKGALNPGQRYTAKILLKIPANSTFDSAGIHFRTGNDNSEIMERDYIYIDSITSAAETMLRGTSYTPDMGYATDSQHLTTGQAKWANIVFKNPGEGVYEIKAEVVVSEAAPVGSTLELHYRGWGKKAGYLRFPTDAVLGSSEAVELKQALYANTKVQVFSVGAGSLCGEKFCTTLSVEDVAAGVKTVVFDEYPAKVAGSYKLRFYITGISSAVYASSELQISEPTGSVSLGDYEILDVLGAKHSGTANASSLSVEIGDISKDDSAQGIVNFTPQKEGTSELALALLSKSTKEKIMEKKLRIKALSADEMTIDIIPKMVVPYINNNLLVRASDKKTGNTISGATVEIIKDNALLDSGTTDASGIFAYTLASPNAGSVVKIRVEKPGYAPAEISVTITEDILLVVPPEVKESLNALLNEENKERLVVANITEIPLTVTGIKASGDFLQYVTLSWSEDYESTQLGIGEDANLDFVLKLNDRGRRVDEPKSLEGSIAIRATSTGYGRTWTTSIPVKIRIVFGDQVDSADCFAIEPDEWGIFTETSVRTLNATLRNNCTVNGTKIALRGLEAKAIAGADNEVGEFEVETDISGASTVALTKDFQRIADVVSAGAEQGIAIKFKPADISSADASPQIVFRASNPAETGTEEMEETIVAKIRIDKLTECLEFVNADNMVIEGCPYNTGYGLYGNYSSGQQGYGQYGNYFGGQYSGGYNPLSSQYYQNMGRTYPNAYTGNMNQGMIAPFLVPAMAPEESAGAGEEITASLSAAENTPAATAQTLFEPTVQMGPFELSSNRAAYFQTTTGLPSYIVPATSTLPYYGSANQNPAMNSAWSCGKRPFKIRNNCGSEIEIDLEAEQGLVLGKSTFKLEQGKEQEVSVESSYLIGTYNINVRAKVAGSKEAASAIRQIPVSIRSMMTSTYEDCISTNPARTLAFNNFLGTPVALEVVNTCYPNVVLQPRTDTIRFGTIGLAMPSQPLQSGIQDVVSNWAYRDQHIEGAGAAGAVQVLRFEVLRNTAYKRNVPEFPTGEGSAIQQIGMLRYFLTAGSFALQAPTTLTVRFTDPYGRQNYATFSMYVEDLWAAGPFFEAMTRCKGDKECEKKARDQIAKGETPTAVPGKDVGGLCKTDTDCKQPENPCKGMKCEALASGDSKKCVEHAKADNTPCNNNLGKCVSENCVTPVQPVALKACEGNLGYTGADAFKKYGFNKLLFDWRWDKISKDTCDVYKNNLAGAEPADADKQADYNFCDATQATLALNKKAKNVQTLVQQIITNGITTGSIASAETLLPYVGETADVTDDALAGKPVLKFYAAKEGTLVENKLDSTKLGIIGTDLTTIKGAAEGTFQALVTTWMPEKVLTKLSESTNAESAKDIIALIEAVPVETIYGDSLNMLGLDKKLINGKNYYVWTFNEYKHFHDKIVTALSTNAISTDVSKDGCDVADDAQVKQCTITSLRTTTETITTTGGGNTIQDVTTINKVVIKTELLKAIYTDGKLRFIASCRNGSTREGCGNAMLIIVKTKTGITLPSEYANWNEFYLDNLAPDMYLMKDGYSEDFRLDFGREYEPKELITKHVTGGSATQLGFKAQAFQDTWKFSAAGNENPKVEAGSYSLNLAYSWQACTGEAKKCSAYNEGTKCTGAGCTWDAATSKCSGTSPKACSTYTKTEECTAAGCKWNIQNNPTTIAVTIKKSKDLAAISADYASNILFSLPIDGEVGTVAARARKGYGIDWDVKLGGIKNIVLAYQEGAAPGDEPLNPFHVLGIGETMAKVDAKYHSTYADTKSGTVVKIAPAENAFAFDYYPSDPVPIQLKVAPQQTTGAVFYNILFALDASEQKRMLGEIAAGQSMLEWKPDKRDSKQAVAQYCPQSTLGEQYGITALGTGTYQTIAYLPATSGKDKGISRASLAILCSAGSLAGTFAYDAMGDNATNSELQGTSLALNADDKARTEKKYSLESLLQMVNGNYICVNPGTTSLELAWNPEQLYKDAGIATEEAK